MKDVKDILFICQARLASQRVPQKMTKPFCGTNLLQILIDKVKSSKVIPIENFYLSLYDSELIDLALRNNVNFFKRSEKSALEENETKIIWEWHNKLPFKYVIMLSACNPLLKIETIDSFTKSFLSSEKQGSFGVIAKKQYFWDQNKKMISDWPSHQKVMNTKTMNVTYEAAHCLYASRMDIIKDGYWMDTKTPPEPDLFVMNELEAFDIDYQWQFDTAEVLYKNKVA